MATDVQLAWAAGFVDGEGCIDIRCCRNNSIVLKLHVTNTCKEGLEHFAQIIKGGDLRLLHGAGYRGLNYKECWVYELYNAFAFQAIVLMLPYICIKRKQAALAIECYHECSPGGKRIHRLSIKQIAARQLYQEEMKALNKRGIN
jgi:hypothetical protein